MPERTLYVFDGYNLLHAGTSDSRDELVDRLAGFVALRGARGVVVFDGEGEERRVGSLEVRFARHADTLVERLAAERRGSERVAVVSSDAAVRETAGPWVERRSAELHARARERAAAPSEPGGPLPGGERARSRDPGQARTTAAGPLVVGGSGEGGRLTPAPPSPTMAS